MNEQNEELAKKLAHLLSDVMAFSLITQGYHWNVKGLNFHQFHALFSDIYSDVSDSIDPLAENIRKLGYDSPYMLSDFMEMTCINEERLYGDAIQMVTSLVRTNQIVLDCTNGAFTLANSTNQQGIANFLAERIDMHQKWQWQLESTLGIR